MENFYNRYHRYLNLPFDIQKPELFNTTPNHVVHQPLDNYYDKNMVDFFHKHNMEILLIECFYTPPNGGKVPIHTDFWWWETDFVKINMTWGPDDGEIVWWKCDKTFEFEVSQGHYKHDDVELEYNDKIRVLTASPKNCTKLYSAVTNQPSLVNTGILHSTTNPSNQPRWTVCFVPVWDKKTEAYVTWDEALNIWKDYLVGE